MKYIPIDVLKVYLALGDMKLEVGRLALIRRKIYFEYSPSFIATGLQISPYRLPLKAGAVTMSDPVFQGLFGVFNDSLPDGWGRLLLDRQIRSLGITPEQLGPLDRLTHVGRFGMGALIYEPSHDGAAAHPDRIDLDRIAEEAVEVINGEVEDVIAELIELAGSSAGARPKIMVGVSSNRSHVIHGQQELPPGYDHWMIKFVASIDQRDAGIVEYAYSLMAKAAGLEMMPTCLFKAQKDVGYFGVQRFDRNHNQRLHLLSLAGLVHSDHRVPAIDYDMVLRATQFLTKSAIEVKKAFRLCCFNVFAHNRDDHAKNFSFLMNEQGQWKLAPAYDLTFVQGPGGEHCTTVLGEGKSPGRSHLLELASKFGISETDAALIAGEVRSAVDLWLEYAEQAGLSKTSARAIAKVIR
ncbi:MAG: type II toxin-antitoxin system HipA family toxin [Pirellulaceae bacterium]|nr:type II toxin-antitoxin system HipA family toxin [Pirellulaceae bacterium]